MRAQKGSSLLTMLCFVVLGIILLLSLLRILPIYLDNFTLNRVITNMDGSSQIKGASAREIRDALSRRLQIDNIEGLDVREIDIQVERDRATMTFTYERRSPFIGNIEVIITFDHEHELRL